MTPNSSLVTRHSSPVPLIAIIGRPNVGKSTLFNRILGTKAAIVDDVPGVTRDRHYADGTYCGRPFRLVDTGGLEPSATAGMIALIKHQSQLAIAEADILILLMDGRAGLTPADEEIVGLLRGTQKPVFVAINKIDTPKTESLLADFYKLGFDQLHPISAEHGLGVDELLEALLPLLPEPSEDAPVSEIPRIAVVGRPNVGKSTLVNTLFGQERMVVSDVPGTTRDSVDTLVTWQGRRYLFTDTAGIRRRGRVERGIEGYSVARAMRAMGRSDIAVLVLDGVEGITEQDTKIIGLVLKQGRACVLLVNKWDLRSGESGARDRYSKELKRRLPFVPWAPVHFGSAMKPDSVAQIFPLLDRVAASFTGRIPTGKLNKFLQELLAIHPLPVRKGRPGKTTLSAYITQVSTRPPAFALFVGHPENVTANYLKLLENRLRESFEFPGVPLRILVRKK